MIKASEKFEKALELQEQGIPREEIWKLLEYKCVDPLTKMFKRRGYKYNEELGKYVLQETYNSNSPVPVKKEPLAQAQPFNEEMQDKIIRLIDRVDDIENIIEWFKTKDNDSNTEVIQVIQGLHIDLPQSENVMISTRSNKIIWEQFNKFCEEHSQFKKGDLLAKALLDLMETYK